jgi:diguanylate cyclase (GGDEF)-like protein/PAS domain S-box-containing protein
VHLTILAYDACEFPVNGFKFTEDHMANLDDTKQDPGKVSHGETSFRDIIDTTPVPLALIDAQGNITYVNDAFIQAVGYTTIDMPDLSGWRLRACRGPHDRGPHDRIPQNRESIAECWQKNIEEATRTGKPFATLEASITCRDGKVRTFLLSPGNLAGDFDGNHLVILHDVTQQNQLVEDLRLRRSGPGHAGEKVSSAGKSVPHDIGGRKSAEAALKQYKLMIDSARDGFWVLDMNGYLQEANRAYADMSGYSADELLNKHVSDLEAIDDAHKVKARIEKLMTQGYEQFESQHRHKDGHVFDVEVSLNYIAELQQMYAFFRDITERKRSEQQIHQLAFYDALTSLPNRRLLLDRLHQAMAVSMRNGRYGALLFLDLDHFKSINDTRGHAVGDLLLIEVARRLQSCVRDGDSVARFGGDEFVVLLEDLSSQQDEAAAQTESVAEKIRDALSHPYLLKDYECLTTPSIGISLFLGYLEKMEDLLKHADIAMYQSKTAGRNAIRFFDPDMQAAIEARSELDHQLRQALSKLQFCLHYQIQVDGQGRPLGAEVLLRWKHPKRGLVHPMQFIALAEETGLIVPIGLWVLHTACAQLKAWQHDALTRDLTLSVNVSAKQFRQADFVAQVQRLLLESGAQPSRLKLELTESAVLESVEETINKMQELKLLGLSFSMDDFGTGYSSLQYLKRLPLDQIKIDQSFVRDITTDPNDAAIVQTIIAMADSLGLDVMAEGVETREQQKFLDKHGCQAMQGHLFSKPVTIEKFEILLNKAKSRHG